MSEESRLRVAIVGSGVTGLAAASFLHRQGVDVLLLEKENYIGGHCYTFENKELNIPRCDLGFMVLLPVMFVMLFFYFMSQKN